MNYNKRPINFVLFGYYGFGNLGDELLCSSLARELILCGYKKETLRILVGHDDSTAKSLGITPLFRKKIFANIKNFFKTKVFLLGGGGIFQDENGILSCLYYLLYEIIAKICGCKIYMIGQSVGPLNTKLGKFLTYVAFKLANKVTVRDEQSKGYLEFHSINSYLHSDLVLLLNNFAEHVDGNLHNKNDFLLLNVRDRYTEFSALAAKKAKEFALQHNLQLRYIAFSLGDKSEFERLIRDKFLPKLPIMLVRDFESFKAEALLSKFALGMRLHFCILSSAFEIPVSLCPYNPKVRNFATRYNLPLLESYDQDVIFKKLEQEDLAGLISERTLLKQILSSI